jgi:glutamate dehydrogenase
MNHDIQNDDFTVRRRRRHVGRRVRQRHAAVAHIRLVAAFDHRDIFLDPNPGLRHGVLCRAPAPVRPAALELAGLQQAKLIRKGGGVFARSLKEIRAVARSEAALIGSQGPGDA